MQVWDCCNVEEGGSFANEFRGRRRLGIEMASLTLRSWMRRFLEFFGKNGAVAILMAGAQSVRITVKDS